jgi:hypothetical protein
MVACPCGTCQGFPDGIPEQDVLLRFSLPARSPRSSGKADPGLGRTIGQDPEKVRQTKNRFLELVYGFKARNVESLLSWLAEEARPFVEKGK